jgi:hypothetical protein
MTARGSAWQSKSIRRLPALELSTDRVNGILATNRSARPDFRGAVLARAKFADKSPKRVTIRLLNPMFVIDTATLLRDDFPNKSSTSRSVSTLRFVLGVSETEGDMPCPTSRLF